MSGPSKTALILMATMALGAGVVFVVLVVIGFMEWSKSL
jgi:hypothetical protein